VTRVIHVITASRIAGGMEAFLARLAPALGRSGLEQIVIARPGGDLSAHLRAQGVETLTYSLYKRRPSSGVYSTRRRMYRSSSPSAASTGSRASTSRSALPTYKRDQISRASLKRGASVLRFSLSLNAASFSLALGSMR